MDYFRASRNVRCPLLSGVFLIVAILFTNATLIAGDSSDHHYSDTVTPNGRADWTAGTVTARGVGIPPKNPTSALQAREMARTAAWSVALRNLLEVLKGVYVDSTTTVSNYVTTNDEVRTKVEGFVKGAKIVKEQEMADGSFETTVEMKLTGDFSNLMLPKPTPRPNPLPQYNRKDKQPTVDKHSTDGTSSGTPIGPRSYTGLVVDARGTGASPALAPRILNEDGEEAYSVAYVEQRDVAKQGIAVYVSDPPSAEAHPRVTNTPLMVKALRAEGKQHTDLVIRDADAQTIHGVPEHFAFLKNAKVLIILDQPR
jgi:hypothetical protein